MGDPIKYYQHEMLTRGEEELTDQMNTSWKIMSEVMSKRDEIQEKMEYFEPYLSTFRKKLVKNKYSVLKRLVFLIKNTKSATI